MMIFKNSLFAVLIVYAKELTFSFENSASSKPPPTTEHHFYVLSGDVSELWAKMVVSLPLFHFFFLPSLFFFFPCITGA
jgi:hypothetical protein